MLLLQGVVLLVAAASLFLWLHRTGVPAAKTTPAGAPDVAVSNVAPAPIVAGAVPTESASSSQTDRRDARTAGSPLATELNAPGSNPVHDIEILHGLLRQYFRHLHGRQGVPIGNDSDLVRALTGHNPMKLVVIPPDHPSITSDGRLRDRWGTPYFIHPRGNDAFDIRSAGADRKPFTSDDVVENPVAKVD